MVSFFAVLRPLKAGGAQPEDAEPRRQGGRDSRHTVGGTLGHGSLATTTADADTVDDIALLGLVAQTASLVGARGTRGTVDDVQLTKLY